MPDNSVPAMGNHALLSASSAHRWMECHPSARLTEAYPDQSSSFAEEGSQAHALCEHYLKTALGLESKDPTADLSFYCPEMAECAAGYAAFVLEVLELVKLTCRDPIVLIEQRLDFSRWVAEGFGTGDCVIVADGRLYIIDYKHGAGVPVSAVENPQMKLYALGAVDAFSDIYDFEKVVMIIYQPRRDNVSQFETTTTELLQWADTELKTAAELAFAGEGEYRSGEWCQFCKAKATCRGRAEENLALARFEFAKPALLEDCEIEAILTQADDLAAWVSDVKEYALAAALGGKQWTQFKLVEGRSNRRYINDEAVAEAVTAAGYDPFEHKLLGITAMEKTLGKAQFNNLLGSLVEKPQGKPALVPNTDKRPPINTAAQDFAVTNN